MFQFDLSLAELGLVGEALALDVQQYPFAFSRIGASENEWVEGIAAASESLYARGYARDGKFVPDFEQGLSVYCLGQPSITVMGEGPRGRLLARANAVDPVGVLAQQDGERMYFAVGGTGDIVPGVLNLLPQHAKGRGRPVTVPGQDPHEPESAGAAAEEEFSNVSYLTSPSGGRSREAEAVARMIGTNWLGGGSIMVESAGPYGAPGTSLTLDWFDTQAGRYIGYSTYGTDGREHIVYTPADTAHMGRILHDFLRRVRQ